jgi:DNA-3-methyladenine glycosylase I|tara:strand:+ start:25757 stop:26344 length:588 start_codon:yes stop_codon:yes gene_type:complete
VTGDAKRRCSWVSGDALYEHYHDTEWGVPETDPSALFRLLMLEGMQAGLSWLTILRKRSRMDEQFQGFSMTRLARASNRDIDHWLTDTGLIRHRGKLTALITNAQAALAHPNFGKWVWSFAPSHQIHTQAPSFTEESTAMSKALKSAGFRFVGPTICYAFMQSAGMVNDHARTCFRHGECQRLVDQALARRGVNA